MGKFIILVFFLLLFLLFLFFLLVFNCGVKSSSTKDLTSCQSTGSKVKIKAQHRARNDEEKIEWCELVYWRQQKRESNNILGGSTENLSKNKPGFMSGFEF